MDGTARGVELWRLLEGSVHRFRAADGSSHARALAFQVTLTLIPGLIAVVGLASVLRADEFRYVLESTAQTLAPGPAGRVMAQALHYGIRFGNAGAAGAALGFGLAATVAAGTSAMGQVERGANRIYGIGQDRPTLQKYGRALGLACSAGLLGIVAFLLIVVGNAVTQALGVRGLWGLVRWPLSLLLAVAAFALLFKLAPNRRHAPRRWRAIGSAVTIVLWTLLTGLLAAYLGVSSQFGEVYGPLAGFIGVLLWALLTALALYLGIAVAAQLETTGADPGMRGGHLARGSEQR